jgi:plasmid stability protein
MKKRGGDQLTIRAVPRRVGARLRERARQEGRSLTTAARFTDLDDLAGTWVDDPVFDRAIAEMDVVDRDLWK